MSLIDMLGAGVSRLMTFNNNVKNTKSIIDLKKGVFNKFVLPGCVCSDGHRAKIFVWDGNREDLMISFNGGGAAFNLDDCKYPIDYESILKKSKMLYSPSAEPMYEYIVLMAKDSGIISPESYNPFSDWSKVIIPYVSADFHTGTADVHYIDRKGKDALMHFNGYTNFIQIMKAVKKKYPNPRRILITGSSAGSFETSALAGKIIDMYPDCQNITIYCDSSYIPNDNWKGIATELWKSPMEITNPIYTDDICGDWLEDLFNHYGDKIKLIYGSSTRDCILAKFTRYHQDGKYIVTEGDCDDIEQGLRNRIIRFRDKGIKINYYINDVKDKDGVGTVHCISQDIMWHTVKMENRTPAEWVMDAVEGKLYDVGMELMNL